MTESKTCAYCGEQFYRPLNTKNYRWAVRLVCDRSCAASVKNKVVAERKEAALLKRYAVDPNGCWIFLGSRVSSGYGRVCVRYKTTRAHRYFYEKLRGPIPTGLVVCHKCDNPICVNPDHLFLGTNKDNTQDSIAKGRRAYQKRLAEAA